MYDDAPKDVKPYLDEIADRLWSYSAVVMVGAGFSYNAEPVGSVSESFPSWEMLGDIFYRKLHGRAPGEEARYLSLLKLAEQVQAAFGRPALDRMLRHAIPDLRYEPSRLHSDLLRLPWQDVFTTNYDTLLERARASVTFSHYDVVATTEDLLYAKAPRIVKLHGSFPSPPFVITEEDYRRYPSDHGPFVNTVRQSLLEKTLCLVGFSGDDPNFLRWIGWLRDQVGMETAPKIFLVGVFSSMSEADRKLLNGRGIVPLDLSGFSTDPGRALGHFLAYLEERRTRALEWPSDSGNAPLRADGSDRSKYREVVAAWRQQRSLYPGWVVVPADRRRSLWHQTQDWLSTVSQMSSEERDTLETPLDLDLAFELAWRLDRCLFPLTGEVAAMLDDVAAKYGDAAIPMPERSHWSKAAVSEAVTNIQLWLLRHYREEGLEEKWESVRRAIDKSVGKLLPEHKARLRLEEALQALYRFDPVEGKRLVVEWPSNENLPFWEAKRAAVMAELGEAEAARSILESSLSAIRAQQSLTPVGEDYTLVSRESLVMLLLWAVNTGLAGGSNLLGELSDRWNELTRHKCDPRREIESFSARLRHDPGNRREETTSHEFDLGLVSTTIHLGPDEEAVAAYGLLRLYEDIGMPYRMENATFVSDPVKATLPRVGPYSPHWALANVVRLGDAKAADWLFDREYVAGLGQDDADRYFDVYLSALDRTVAAVDGLDLSEAKTFESLAKTLPEVFSRLCYKCSPACRERLVIALRRIYDSTRKQVFQNVHRFARRLFDSMSVEEQVRAVPLLIDFPVPDQLGDLETREFVNPLRLLNLSSEFRPEVLDVPGGRVDELLGRLADRGTGRDWAVTSLVWLQKQGKLRGPQSQRLAGLLWEGIEASGVPTVPGFYSFACMRLPHPPGIDPEPRVKEYLKSQIGAKMGSSGLDDVLDELRQSTGVVRWSVTDAFELLGQFRAWWDEHKPGLHWELPMPFGSPAERTKQTIWRMVSTLAAVLAEGTVVEDHGTKNALRDFISDLTAHGIPALRLELAALTKGGDGWKQLIDRIAAGMSNNVHHNIVDALLAARSLATLATDEKWRRDFDSVATKLVQGVEWRHRPALVDRLHVAACLVRDHRWFVSPVTETSLLRGLACIEDESSDRVSGNDGDGVILTRAAAASLAFELFRHYQKLEKNEPEAVRRWQGICRDANEFAEVRNAWLTIRV